MENTKTNNRKNLVSTQLKLEALRMSARKYSREYYRNNYEMVKAKARKYYNDNREKLKAMAKEYYNNNRETIKAKSRKYCVKYYNDNRELKKAKVKKYRVDNAQSISEKRKIRYEGFVFYSSQIATCPSKLLSFQNVQLLFLFSEIN